MRYRLRTLLIVITGFCTVFALWPKYMCYLADFHRRSGLEIIEDHQRHLHPTTDIGLAVRHLGKSELYTIAAHQPWVIITKTANDFPHSIVLSGDGLEDRIPIEVPEY